MTTYSKPTMNTFTADELMEEIALGASTNCGTYTNNCTLGHCSGDYCVVSQACYVWMIPGMSESEAV